MKYIITFFAKLGFWPFVLIFTLLAIIFSDFLVIIHSYILSGEFIDKNLLIAGSTISIINGFIVSVLMALIIRYLKMSQDEKDRVISLQREIEEKLKKSERYQRALLDSFPFLIWLKDRKSNFLAVNKAFAKAAGRENPSDLIGKNDLDFFPEDLAEAYRNDDQLVMALLEKKELEEEIAENGKRKWFQTYKAPIFDDYGNVFATVGFARDITKDKESAERLKLLASVFTSTHEGIIITDTDNKIIDVNEAFSEITGYTRTEVVGKNPNILQSGRNDEAFYTELWNLLQKEGVWKGELWNHKKNGEEYVENTTINAVYDDNNIVRNYVAIFTDITQQKQYEQELEHRAHYDGLTNLPNRTLFADRLQQASAQVMRRQQLLAVVYIDIDGFKQVNDTYGHDIGDKLLVLLSEKMRNLLRDGDTVSRVGGDEFLVLLVDIVDRISINSFLERLLHLVAEPISIDTLLINVSASIGVTFYPQENEIETKQVIKQADQAMYQAKLSGKNKYVIFTGESDLQVQ